MSSIEMQYRVEVKVRGFTVVLMKCLLTQLIVNLEGINCFAPVCRDI